MPSIFFRKCECGVAFRIMNTMDGKEQILTCTCDRQVKIVGTVLSVYLGTSRSGGINERAWMRVTLDKVKNS